VLGDVLDNLLRRPGVFHLRIAVGPRSTVMKRVPRGAEVGAGFRGIAVLPETVADTNLIVPKRLEKIDEISLGRILPSALNDQARYSKSSSCRVSDAFTMVLRWSLSRPHSLSPCSIAVLLEGSAGSAFPT